MPPCNQSIDFGCLFSQRWCVAHVAIFEFNELSLSSSLILLLIIRFFDGVVGVDSLIANWYATSNACPSVKIISVARSWKEEKRRGEHCHFEVKLIDSFSGQTVGKCRFTHHAGDTEHVAIVGVVVRVLSNVCEMWQIISILACTVDVAYFVFAYCSLLAFPKENII